MSEIEAKVNEATSDEAWGASSTLMQEIAGATHNFADFNEIMPLIFRNFMEREAREWRPIYKSLQLLEYLVKHGSERVVDDARSHLGTIKILRNFHYIDEAGKDQGLNVRNRAKELSELLSDVDRIRQERRKARSNRQKYQGAGNGDFVPGSGGGRYGGFGSDSYYAGGGGFPSGAAAGGSSGGGGGARESFDEYDAGDDDASAPPPRRSASAGGRNGGGSSSRSSAAPSRSAKQPEAKVADLFSFDDDDDAQPASAPSTAASAGGAADAFGDDFDDFQSAPGSGSNAPVAKGPPTPSKSGSTTAAAAPKSSGSNVFDFLREDSGNQNNASSTPSIKSPTLSTTSSSILSPTSTGATRPASSSVSSQPLQPSRPSMSSNNSTASASTATKSTTASSGLGGFDDLWAASSGSAAKKDAGNGKKTMADLAKERSGAGVWGAGGSNAQQASSKKDPFDFL